MMNNFKATKSVMATFTEAMDAGKTPWLVLGEGTLLGIFDSRNAARDAKVTGQRKIEKFDANRHFIDDSVAPVVPKTKPIAQAIAEAEAEGKLGKVVAINPIAEVAAAIQAEEAANASPVEKKPKAKAAPVELTEGQRTSTAERPTKAVWFIADEMRLADPLARRKDIIAECQARGIAYFTARTQFQLWSNCQKEMADREAVTK
jgi:hypothetical protein